MRVQIFVLFACISMSVHAQSDRSPNSQELTVIKKAENVIEPFIGSFQNTDWQKQDGGADEDQYLSVQKHPDVPMGVAPFNDWHFVVQPGSKYFNQKIKPIYDKVTALSANNSDENIKQELELGKQLRKLNAIYVEVFVDQKNLPYKFQKGNAGDLNVPGTAYAYEETDANKTIGTQIDGINSYVLAFGDWNNAVADKNLGVYQFKFQHPDGSPYIENIVIRISGNDERIHQLLTTLDWSQINNALTK